MDEVDLSKHKSSGDLSDEDVRIFDELDNRYPPPQPQREKPPNTGPFNVDVYQNQGQRAPIKKAPSKKNTNNTKTNSNFIP